MAETLYQFADRLSDSLPDNAVVVTDAGSAFYLAPALKLRDGMRYLTDLHQGAMGAALPMAIGAALADPERSIFVVTGDGSIMMQLAALCTIAQCGLQDRIKVYVLDNDGYYSIRNTQDNLCEGRYTGIRLAMMCLSGFPFLERVEIDTSTPVRRPVLAEG